MATGNAGADVLLAWTQAGVIAQALGSIGIILTLCYSAWTYLLTSQPPADPLKAREYDAYAAMVWNFLETIVDRCEGTADRHLRDTWYPIVATENAMHRTWFDMPENRRKFKERFRRYIEKNYPVSAAPSVATDAARR
jgi:hypothetical protein